MHFGPEWMRPKHASRPQNPPSPPPNPSPPTGVSSYSALLTPSPNNTQEPSDSANPFLYSKEDLLKIYKDGGRKGLGLDVERWEGVVREVGSEPVALKDWTEGEKKVQPGFYTHVFKKCLVRPHPAFRRFNQFRGASASVKRLPVACYPVWREAETIPHWSWGNKSSEREIWWLNEET